MTAAAFAVDVERAGRPMVRVVGEIDLTNADELDLALTTVHRS